MTQPQEPFEDEVDGVDEVSIDDALEADRGAEGAVDRDLGAEDAAASEQGNRDEDRMEADVPEDVPEL